MWSREEYGKLRRLLFLVPLFLGCSLGWAQTVVQTARCPSSGNVGAGVAGGLYNGIYYCPLPNKTLPGNLIAVFLYYAPTGSTKVTVSDSTSDTYTQAVTATTTNSNTQAIYYLPGAASGITYVSAAFAGATFGVADVSMIVEEWSGIATAAPLDAASCNSATSTSVTAGSMTVGTANDLIVQAVFNDPANGYASPSSETSFSVGSQSNITWTFNASDLNESNAAQSGILTTAGSFNATFTQGTKQVFASCAAAFKSASAGTGPSGIRIISVDHAQEGNGITSPVTLQTPLSGNMFVVSDLSGGEAYITGISSTPSCTWANTGPVYESSALDSYTIIWYAVGCKGASNMTLTLTLAGPTTDDTYMVYDVTNSNAWTFDTDSGGQRGSQFSIVPTVTTCSSCDTPSTTTGIVFGSFSQDECTATGLTAPSGGFFDAATYSGNSLNGAQSVDQNNGWFHSFYTSAPGALTATWTESCATLPPDYWAGRVASFKTTTQTQPQPPTGVKAVVVPQ
jgi:hypothetical protein